MTHGLEFDRTFDLKIAVDDLRRALGSEIRSENPNCRGHEREIVEANIAKLPEYRKALRDAFVAWETSAR